MVVAPLEIAVMVSLTVNQSLIHMPGVHAGFLNILVSRVEKFRFCRYVMNSGVVVQPEGEDRSTAARGRERQW